jgi:hypothetical protein
MLDLHLRHGPGVCRSAACQWHRKLLKGRPCGHTAPALHRIASLRLQIDNLDLRLFADHRMRMHTDGAQGSLAAVLQWELDYRSPRMAWQMHRGDQRYWLLAGVGSIPLGCIHHMPQAPQRCTHYSSGGPWSG